MSTPIPEYCLCLAIDETFVETRNHWSRALQYLEIVASNSFSKHQQVLAHTGVNARLSTSLCLSERSRSRCFEPSRRKSKSGMWRISIKRSSPHRNVIFTQIPLWPDRNSREKVRHERCSTHPECLRLDLLRAGALERFDLNCQFQYSDPSHEDAASILIPFARDGRQHVRRAAAPLW